jgi:pimeloyl-ACP methyl ester carboxylesterase
MWWGFALAVSSLVLPAMIFVILHVTYRLRYLEQVIRIFETKPLFIVPTVSPLAEAEDVTVATSDGLTLRACYLRAIGPRKGVLLFGLEFGSNRWTAVQYCEKLRESGYDVFAYETRNQGESDRDPTYDPLQWVSNKDLVDARAALAYLKSRPDADPRGVGIFGISKGGSLGLLLAAEDRAVRCIVTDGAFATYTTMVPYMRRWVNIYSPYKRLQKIAPDCLYGSVGQVAIRRSAERRGVKFVSLERAAQFITQPVLMIHGESDTYIKPEMAKQLFGYLATTRKEMWIVPGAKHNQAPQIAGDEYPRRLVEFFDTHLAALPTHPECCLEAPFGSDFSTSRKS